MIYRLYYIPQPHLEFDPQFARPQTQATAAPDTRLPLMYYQRWQMADRYTANNAKRHRVCIQTTGECVVSLLLLIIYISLVHSQDAAVMALHVLSAQHSTAVYYPQLLLSLSFSHLLLLLITLLLLLLLLFPVITLLLLLLLYCNCDCHSPYHQHLSIALWRLPSLFALGFYTPAGFSASGSSVSF